ncbi:YbhB/YbcL family Raf kinase inhibitor-like protein [Rosenbergiella australiborealis]|uniref:YbhB/YbcL family Raf kinase inhibitor-like protein n=1 Tax=Rosenbergiella australiborealis TaxID=1544696 RepID=A0ABS5T7Y0_9GAMM|nr:YbhB/YbcL family Raf kinase inhibitor-like protein [Rosenbergiella australiborealis]MBT0728450.1 YbhB/YbcL family Raf kinase inhibitor-like protein [Rosenbergiella australiborealis]
MSKLLSSVLFLATLGGVAVANAAPFTLTSPDFSSGKLLPPAAGGKPGSDPACHGKNISPLLEWQNPPANTKSYALLIQDPQGRKGLGVTHLIAYDIPGNVQRLERTALSNGKGFVGGLNSKGTLAYVGPCPPTTLDLHYYTFTLIATDLAANALPPGLLPEELFHRLEGHALASAGMVAAYQGSN